MTMSCRAAISDEMQPELGELLAEAKFAYQLVGKRRQHQTQAVNCSDEQSM